MWPTDVTLLRDPVTRTTSGLNYNRVIKQNAGVTGGSDNIKEITASGDFKRFVAEAGCDTPEKALPWGDCWQPYSNLMTHQLCAAAHTRVPSFDAVRCYTDNETRPPTTTSSVTKVNF